MNYVNYYSMKTFIEKIIFQFPNSIPNYLEIETVERKNDEETI